MKKILYISFIILLTNSGCKKFLEHQPDDRTKVDSPVKVAELLATAYPHANYITFCEAMSDNAADKGVATQMVEINTRPWMYEDQNKTERDTPNNYWNGCYEAIAAANEALSAIEKAGGGAEYNNSKGEALISRAYAHFMLVTLFSKTYNPATAASDMGIPYILSPIEVVEGKYERKTVEYVFNQVEKDLLEGINLLVSGSYKVPKFHFTKEAAYAFATRFYLFKKDYQKVVDYANLIYPTATVANSLRPWNTSYNTLGYYEIQALYTNSTTIANLLLAEANTLWGGNFYFYNYGMETNVVANLYNADKNPIGVQLVYRSKVFGSSPEFYNIPKFGENDIKESINATTYQPYNTIPLFTVEEVLFNRAEANANLGVNANVLTDIDAFLSKRVASYNATTHKFTEAKATAFYPGLSVKDALIQSVLNYKRQEFVFEGMRWFDIKRLNIPVVHRNIKGTINITLAPDDPRRVLQLPKEVIAYGLTANPR